VPLAASGVGDQNSRRLAFPLDSRCKLAVLDLVDVCESVMMTYSVTV
jgi:hypothetical protein